MIRSNEYVIICLLYFCKAIDKEPYGLETSARYWFSFKRERERERESFG